MSSLASENSNSQVSLEQRPEGLTLVGNNMEIRGDFITLYPRIIPGKVQKELLVKASRIKGLETAEIVDMTAGMGEDSLLLAAAGFSVTMFEQDAVIAALLEDAMKRAIGDRWLDPIVKRMKLIVGNSIEGLKNLEENPDVVYLDPMFPERTKSASVKKKFQLLHELQTPCDNEQEMLEAAKSVKPKKIVIKRPPKGPYLADQKPAYSLTGKAVRYDVIIPIS